MESTPLLLTSAINCDQDVPYLALKKHEERLFQTVCCLISWSQAAYTSPIILCDNTQPNYDFSAIIEYARRHGVALEIITFKGDMEKTREHGKGYGEGEIIEYALSHSKYLQDDAISFYKLTSRLFVPNFPIIHKQCDGISPVFPRIPSTLTKKNVLRLCGIPLFLPTVFYKCGTGFYRNSLLTAYKNVHDPDNCYMEHVFYVALRGHGFSTFRTTPILIGMSGTNATILSSDYPAHIKKLAQEFCSGMSAGK